MGLGSQLCSTIPRKSFATSACTRSISSPADTLQGHLRHSGMQLKHLKSPPPVGVTSEKMG